MDKKRAADRKAILELCAKYALHNWLWEKEGLIVSEVKAHEFCLQLKEMGIDPVTALFLGERQSTN